MISRTCATFRDLWARFADSALRYWQYLAYARFLEYSDVSFLIRGYVYARLFFFSLFPRLRFIRARAPPHDSKCARGNLRANPPLYEVGYSVAPVPSQSRNFFLYPSTRATRIRYGVTAWTFTVCLIAVVSFFVACAVWISDNRILNWHLSRCAQNLPKP